MIYKSCSPSGWWKRTRYWMAHQHVVCMACDFFHPRLGGVEQHILSLSHHLIARGRKVIVVTRGYDDRIGVRYFTNGIKVYYAPMKAMPVGVVVPVFLDFLPIFRSIVLREGVTIVHGHQATSTIAHNCITYARVMGLKTVFTAHSLLDPTDVASIYLNKIMSYSLCDADHAICVSRACRDNLLIGTGLDPARTSVIPNAVDSDWFQPAASVRTATPLDAVTIVLLSRLVYRKGIDLAVEVIPKVCRRCPGVRFVIGGDGDRMLKLQEMREAHFLHDRVQLLGAVAQKDVPSVLCQGQIFLNCSLTEAFCMAVLEAASCGLYVVSTNVGGLQEVLPDDMVSFAEPTVDSLVDAVCSSLDKAFLMSPRERHQRVRSWYSWTDVARDTELLYDRMSSPKHDETFPSGLAWTLKRHRQTGPVFGIFMMIMMAIYALLTRLVDWLRPPHSVDRAPHYCCALYGAGHTQASLSSTPSTAVQ